MARGVHFSMALFFSYAAYVNINDHDWYFWVPLYLIAFLLAITAAVKSNIIQGNAYRENRGLAWQSVALFEISLCYVYIAFLVYSTTLFLYPQGEHLRELGGLVIILTWLGYSLFYGSSKRYRGISSWMTVLGFLIWVLPLLVWSPCFNRKWNQQTAYCSRIDPNSWWLFWFASWNLRLYSSYSSMQYV